MKGFYSLLCWFSFGLLVVLVASGGYFAGWWSDTALVLQFMSAILWFWVGRLTMPNRRLMLRFIREYLDQIEAREEDEEVLESYADEELEYDEEEENPEKELQNRRRMKALEIMTNMAVIPANSGDRHICLYCHRQSGLLQAYPHDPRLHLERCIVPMARGVLGHEIPLVPDEVIVGDVLNEWR